jgi:8-oxo-dGTP pyrophosphatase MutT (NUDIX family)
MTDVLNAGCIPWRRRDGMLEVLLITSRHSGNWGIPKGWIEPGQTPAEAAAQETWEEAGVLGQLSPTPIGTYRKRDYDVAVFLLYVERELDDWPERDERQRAWFAPHEATARLENRELTALIASLHLHLEP